MCRESEATLLIDQEEIGGQAFMRSIKVVYCEVFDKQLWIVRYFKTKHSLFLWKETVVNVVMLSQNRHFKWWIYQLLLLKIFYISLQQLKWDFNAPTYTFFGINMQKL